MDLKECTDTDKTGRSVIDIVSAIVAIVVTLIVISSSRTALAIERPKNINALSSAEIEEQLSDPLVSAYASLINDKLAVDQEALARIAHFRRRNATPAIFAEYTLVLLDALLETEATPVDPPPPGGREELAVNRSALKVDPGPPTHHDLNFLSGRAAFLLERLYDIKLPPSKQTDTEEQRQELQRDAVRQILLAKMKNELEVIPRLTESERIRLAKDRWTPPAVLEILVDDPSAEVLFALAEDRGIPNPGREKLWKRMQAETNPEVKKRLFNALTKSIASPIDAKAHKKRDLSVRELIEQAWDLIEKKRASRQNTGSDD